MKVVISKLVNKYNTFLPILSCEFETYLQVGGNIISAGAETYGMYFQSLFQSLFYYLMFIYLWLKALCT